MNYLHPFQGHTKSRHKHHYHKDGKIVARAVVRCSIVIQDYHLIFIVYVRGFIGFLVYNDIISAIRLFQIHSYFLSIFSFVKSEPGVRVITVNTELKSEISPMVHEVAEPMKSTSESQLRVLTFSTPQSSLKKLQGKRNKRIRGVLAYRDKEFLRLEKRRIELQVQQLGILKGIQKQMEMDSERNHAFQEEFLEILRKGIQTAQVSTEK